MMRLARLPFAAAALLLGACADTPTAPADLAAWLEDATAPGHLGRSPIGPGGSPSPP